MLLLSLLLACTAAPPATVRADPDPDPTPEDTGVVPDDTGLDDPDPVGGDPYDPVDAPATLDLTALAAIADDIDAILASTTATSGVLIVDVDSGQEVYAANPDLPLKPASNTKLFTTGVAFDVDGADNNLLVQVWASAAPDATGHVDSLSLLGLHDFSWSTDFYNSDDFVADRLAQQLWQLGLRDVGSLEVRGEYAVDAYHFGTYSAPYHLGEASALVDAALSARGISVGSLSTSAGLDPNGALRLTSYRSSPLSVACYPLNTDSNNEMADILGRRNGWRFAASSSYSAGADAVEDWMLGLGIDTTGLSLHDGSGLSHDNRVTARMLVEIQRAMLSSPSGDDWRRTFAVAGWLGTLAGRMTGPDTLGRFFGKSGTLNGVIATSGQLEHVHDGHRYLISVLMNDVSSSSGARSQQNQLVEAVASDRRGLGLRPEQPVVRWARARRDGTLDVAWSAVSGTDAYELWLSPDGRVWDRSLARKISGTRHRAGELAQDVVWYARVRAVNSAGLSDPSDVVAARVGVPSELLLVDGNDRYAWQWENPSGAGHDFVVDYGEAMGDRGFDTAANEEIISGKLRLEDYDAVIWMLGEESSADLSFDADERDLVGAYLDGGGALLVSGSEIGWDLVELGDADTIGWFSSRLHASYLSDDADSTVVTPSGDLFAGLGDLNFYRPGQLDVAYPDQLAAAQGATSELEYVDGAGGTAAVRYDGASRVVMMGFPLEALDDRASRAAVLGRVLDFLSP